MNFLLFLGPIIISLINSFSKCFSIYGTTLSELFLHFILDKSLFLGIFSMILHSDSSLNLWFLTIGAYFSISWLYSNDNLAKPISPDKSIFISSVIVWGTDDKEQYWSRCKKFW